jgi:putative effector of murein hydrolase LrgA (UPF0299 family)
MQPFSSKTIIAVTSSVIIYFLCYYLFRNLNNWFGIVVRSGVFSMAFILSVVYFRLSPDAPQLWEIAVSRLKRR